MKSWSSILLLFCLWSCTNENSITEDSNELDNKRTEPGELTNYVDTASDTIYPEWEHHSETINFNEGIDICDCLNATLNISDFDEIQMQSASCFKQFAAGDKEKYFMALAFSFYNCPKFLEATSELSFKSSQFDTIPFKPATVEDCHNFTVGSARDFFAEPGTYTISEGDTVKQFVNNNLSGVWELIDQDECNYTYRILRNDEGLPPLAGDTVSTRLIGVYDSLQLTEFIFNGVILKSVGIKN